MIDIRQSFNIARFPTRREAETFAEQQAPFIELFHIQDATELHPQVKDSMPISVLSCPEIISYMKLTIYG